MRSLIRRAWATVAPRPGEELAQWQRPGPWFALVAVLGFAIRAYFVLATEGTYDVPIWESHARGVRELGLIDYYHFNLKMNHPPMTGLKMAWLLGIAESANVPFRVLLRAPFALLDLGTALLLLWALRSNRHRFLLTASYWIYPLAMIFSAYHGNTDSSIPFFVLLSLLLIDEKKIYWAAVLLGLSFGIKLPGLLATPVLFFAIAGWGSRLRFLSVALLVGAATFLPGLLQDPQVVWRNVMQYRGQMIQTTGQIPVWGMWMFLPDPSSLSEQWRAFLQRPIYVFMVHNSWCSLVPIAALTWMRRHHRKVDSLAWTITGVNVILYGFSNYWSFQYFAWSIPFWFLAGYRFLLPASLFAGAYIYGLYWLVCGNPWLLGSWDFAGHPQWPQIMIVLRNLAQLFFFFAAFYFLTVAIKEQVVRFAGWMRRRRGDTAAAPP